MTRKEVNLQQDGFDDCRHTLSLLLANFDKLLLYKYYIIGAINDPLKNIFDLEHSRHRLLTSYVINIVSSLMA